MSDTSATDEDAGSLAGEPIINGLAALDTAVISDAMERFGAVDPRIRPLWSGARLAGRALTVWTHSGDNLLVRQALELLAPGDVLVVNGQGDESRALIGDVIARQAQARGGVGAVLDGAARDVERLESFALRSSLAPSRQPGPTTTARGGCAAPWPSAASWWLTATSSSATATASSSCRLQRATRCSPRRRRWRSWRASSSGELGAAPASRRSPPALVGDCRGRSAVAATGPVRSGVQLDEAGRREVPVEGKGTFDAASVHHREARGVHPGVLALVVPAQPDERLFLGGFGDSRRVEAGGPQKVTSDRDLM